MPHKDKEIRKEYNRINSAKWYRNNKEKSLEANRNYKKKKRKEWSLFKSRLSCSKCGESHPAIIDFHHDGDKEKAVSKFVQDGQYSKAYAEVEKCIPICANCHRILHWEKRNE